MSNKVQYINIRNHAYYFFDDINIKDFDPNNIKIDKNVVIRNRKIDRKHRLYC